MNVASAGKGGKSSDKYKARLDGGVVVGRKGKRIEYMEAGLIND